MQWRIQDPDQNTPIVHQFSVGPEWQFAQNMVAAVDYVGNRVRNGRRLRNLNQGIIDTSTGTTCIVYPYAQYGYGNAFLEQIITVGRSDYNALQTRLQRRMTGGLGFTVAYTFGSAKGDFLDHLSAGGGAVGNTPQNTYDLDADYGPLPFDVRHRLVAELRLRAAVGRGTQVRADRHRGALARDWSLNGILTLNSGLPFTAHLERAGRHRRRPLSARRLRRRRAARRLRSDDRSLVRRRRVRGAGAQHLSAAAATTRYAGPASKSMNVSVFRSIVFGERRVEFRIETFNLFNWVNFGFPRRQRRERRHHRPHHQHDERSA